MTPGSSRREFIRKSAQTGLSLYVGSSLLSACSTGSRISPSKYTTGFQQDKLPYSYNALSEAIDGTTMEIHFTKHAAGYATNLQAAVKDEGVGAGTSLEELLGKTSKYTSKMRNNAGGHYNHELFWKVMTPNAPGKPSGKLAAAIDKSFNSFDSFKTAFEDAGKNRFGSGWAWLLLDNDKNLRISSTANQDNPLMDVAEAKGFPLLGLDVWEHAYYLRYQNKRADYITAWWKVVNWNYVGERFDAVV